MDSIGHFIWLVMTMPIYGILSLIWIFLKLIFFSIIGLLRIINGNLSLEDLFFLPFRIIAQSFKNHDSIYKWFSNFYYEHTSLSWLGIIFLFVVYSGLNDRR